ncbi:hypothetical protein WA588_002218 [Blastocystis sp. NMH]
MGYDDGYGDGSDHDNKGYGYEDDDHDHSERDSPYGDGYEGGPYGDGYEESGEDGGYDPMKGGYHEGGHGYDDSNGYDYGYDREDDSSLSDRERDRQATSLSPHDSMSHVDRFPDDWLDDASDSYGEDVEDGHEDEGGYEDGDPMRDGHIDDPMRDGHIDDDPMNGHADTNHSDDHEEFHLHPLRLLSSPSLSLQLAASPAAFPPLPAFSLQPRQPRQRFPALLLAPRRLLPPLRETPANLSCRSFLMKLPRVVGNTPYFFNVTKHLLLPLGVSPTVFREAFLAGNETAGIESFETAVRLLGKEEELAAILPRRGVLRCVIPAGKRELTPAELATSPIETGVSLRPVRFDFLLEELLPANRNSIPANSSRSTEGKNDIPNISNLPSNSENIPANGNTIPSNSPKSTEDNNDIPSNSPTIPSNSNNLPSNSPKSTEDNNDIPSNSPTIPSNSNNLPSNSPKSTEDNNDIPSNSPTIPSNSNNLPSNSPKSTEDNNDIPSNSPTIPSNSTSRRLGDSYRDSLVHTSLQLSRRFGSLSRAVPAHMPHLLHRPLLARIEHEFPAAVAATLRHRFREGTDLQFAFLYFHFRSGLDATRRETSLAAWLHWLDLDRDGALDAHEFRLLAEMLYGESDTTTMRRLAECVTNRSVVWREREDPAGNLRGREVVEGKVMIDQVMACEEVVRMLRQHATYVPLVEVKTDEDVAFQMISDDIADTQRQLDSVRRRKSKFICINDDIKQKNEQLDAIIHDFYESFFPTPSQFEKNRQKEIYRSRWDRTWAWLRNTYVVKYSVEILMVILMMGLIVAFVVEAMTPDRRTKEVQV